MILISNKVYELRERTCLECGQKYMWSFDMGPKRQYFCCDECEHQHNWHTCLRCGKEFRKKDNCRHKFCSSECAYAYRSESEEYRAFARENSKKGNVAKQELKAYRNIDKTHPLRLVSQGICAWCGKSFETILSSGVCCCAEHTYLYTVKNSTAGRVRRARLKGAKVLDKTITLPKVVERDNGICWLCGELVDWDDHTTGRNGHFVCGPNYPNIDHVVPLSKGGNHSWDNVRCSHARCNMSRGNRDIV